MWNYILKAKNSHVTFLAKYQPAKKTISPKWGCLRKYTPFYGHKGFIIGQVIIGKLPMETVWNKTSGICKCSADRVTLVNIRLGVTLVNVPSRDGRTLVFLCIGRHWQAEFLLVSHHGSP